MSKFQTLLTVSYKIFSSEFIRANPKSLRASFINFIVLRTNFQPLIPSNQAFLTVVIDYAFCLVKFSFQFFQNQLLVIDFFDFLLVTIVISSISLFASPSCKFHRNYISVFLANTYGVHLFVYFLISLFNLKKKIFKWVGSILVNS